MITARWSRVESWLYQRFEPLSATVYSMPCLCYHIYWNLNSPIWELQISVLPSLCWSVPFTGTLLKTISLEAMDLHGAVKSMLPLIEPNSGAKPSSYRTYPHTHLQMYKRRLWMTEDIFMCHRTTTTPSHLVYTATGAWSSILISLLNPKTVMTLWANGFEAKEVR